MAEGGGKGSGCAPLPPWQVGLVVCAVLNLESGHTEGGQPKVDVAVVLDRVNVAVGVINVLHMTNATDLVTGLDAKVQEQYFQVLNCTPVLPPSPFPNPPQ